MTSGPRIPGDVDRDLERIRRSWSRLEASEPPDLVDRAVLNAARRAIERPSRRKGWLAALATASVVVLTLAVVVRQEGEPPAVQEKFESDTLALPLADEAAEPPATELREMHSTPGPALTARAAAAERSSEDERLESSPEAWIDRLRRLRSNGDEQAFARELEAFRKAYPDYVLPSDLLE